MKGWVKDSAQSRYRMHGVYPSTILEDFALDGLDGHVAGKNVTRVTQVLRFNADPGRDLGIERLEGNAAWWVFIAPPGFSFDYVEAGLQNATGFFSNTVVLGATNERSGFSLRLVRL